MRTKHHESLSALAGPESSKAIYRVALEVRVDNVAALYAAAKAGLEAANIAAQEIEGVLCPGGEKNVSNCLRTLLNPGASLGGCSIVNSSADELMSESRTLKPALDQMLAAFDPKKHGGEA